MITGILRKPPYEHMISLCASTWQQLAAWHMAMLGFLWLQSWCPSLSERGSFSCPRSSGLLFSVDSTSFGIFLWFFEHQKWIVAVASWSYHIISMCFWLADLLLAEMRVIPNGWSLEIKDQESPFRCGEAWPRPAISHHHSYWTWWFIVDLPIENGDFP